MVGVVACRRLHPTWRLASLVPRRNRLGRSDRPAGRPIAFSCTQLVPTRPASGAKKTTTGGLWPLRHAARLRKASFERPFSETDIPTKDGFFLKVDSGSPCHGTVNALT